MTASKIIKLVLTSGVISVLFLFTGCAITPEYGKAYPPAEKLNVWEARGKLGLKMRGRANSASFHWRHHAPNYKIHLYGPFGQGSVHIERDSNTVSLRSDKHNAQADDAETLLNDTLGWALPISELPFWLKGIPAPGSPYEIVSSEQVNNPKQIKQQGWNLNYGNFRRYGDLSLPHKIKATREGVALTIVIKQWTPAN